ncbi:MAG: methyltransferase domain-containing protein [Lachnospiraceae bacterium]
MKKEGFYSSGEFANLAHISVRTVRYYDKLNILKPSYVTQAGARFYTEDDLVRLQQILLLKYLGFSLDDIRMLTVEDSDYRMLRHSLELQLKLVRDRIEQMQMVEQAIEETTNAIENNNNVDWSQMLHLIHLTNMESSLKTQYQNATNISARINLHQLYSINPMGWFPWVFEQCHLKEGMKVLELGCGSGALWKDNYERIPHNISIVLNDISEGMLRDTRREIEDLEAKANNNRFSYHAFDCHEIPDEDGQYDIVIANHLLFYCSDIKAVLAEVKRVLKNGGRFICSTYGKNHMKEITQLVQSFQSQITLSADYLYENFGLENGDSILGEYFDNVSSIQYEDGLVVTQPEPLIEYILSCHGNQNQYLLDRYKDFRSFVERKTKKGFHITKEAGIFTCKKIS